jgi:hypothetical protein
MINTAYTMIATYLDNQKAPSRVRDALRLAQQAWQAWETTADNTTAAVAIESLWQSIQSLHDRMDKQETQGIKPSYASVAAQGLASTLNAPQPCFVGTGAKPVPAWHKREIVMFRGKEDQTQLDRTRKELAEQLNNTGVKVEVVAVYQLPSGDLILTMEDEKARNQWLANQL